MHEILGIFYLILTTAHFTVISFATFEDQIKLDKEHRSLTMIRKQIETHIKKIYCTLQIVFSPRGRVKTTLQCLERIWHGRFC